MALLVEKRRVTLSVRTEEWVLKAAQPLKEAPLTAEIVLEALRLTLPHADPADRFLVATARELGLALVTADPRLIDSRAVATMPND